MAFDAATVWEVRTTGNDANGGGFKAGATGTDYSQQDAAQVAYTDLVIDGTTNTKVTSTAHPFDATSPGNVINVTGGTGFTVQRVQIVSVAAGVATCDKSLGTLGSTGGTGSLGGALASPGQAGALHVASNTIYIKNGTYSITSTTANVAGGKLAPVAGVATAWTHVFGYNTTRGDNPTGSGRPILQASGVSSFTLITLTNSVEVCYVQADGNAQAATTGIDAGSGTSSRVYLCKSLNCTSSGYTGSNSTFFGCEASACGNGFNICLTCLWCVAHGCTTTGFFKSGGCYNCIAYANTGANTDGFQVNSAQAVNWINCTSYGNGRHGFNVASTSVMQQTWANLLSVGNSGFGYNDSSGSVDFVSITNCAHYNNFSGGFGTNLQTGNIRGAIALTADPFTNAAGGDFSLNGTAGGGAALRAAGIFGAFPGGTTTGYADVGAVQHQDAGGGDGGLKSQRHMTGGLV